MKFKVIAAAIIVSSVFTVFYFYVFTTILFEPNTKETSLYQEEVEVYYNQLGCFKSPDTMIGILEAYDIDYTTYTKGEFTYIISGIADNVDKTNENAEILERYSIDYIMKHQSIPNVSNKGYKDDLVQLLSQS